jgi:hypothetical protein
MTLCANFVSILATGRLKARGARTLGGMPRPPRPQIAGAVYHVTARAVDGQALFRDPTDRVHFFRVLERSVRRTPSAATSTA